MRYPPEHKEAARAKILLAVGRGFRKRGYDGIGVDGLAKEAGVTSGAFYGHFPTKSAAFEAAALTGLVDLRLAIEGLRASEGSGWLAKFVDFYLSAKRTCDLGDSCALQSLTPEVARAGHDTRVAYEAELLKVVDAVAAGLPGDTAAARKKLAWTVLATLTGGVTLARAAENPKIGAHIATALKTTLAAVVAAATPG